MKLAVGLALITYYTWWILLLVVVLLIIIFKLLTQQNFQVAFRVGITSNGTLQQDQFLLEPVLVRKKGKSTLNQTHSPEDNTEGEHKVHDE